MLEKIYLKKVIMEKDSDFGLLQKAFKLGREECFEQLKKSGLTGRGGAGFPTYKKWSFVNGKEDIILICNADEGEPGTFKDRYIMENNPKYFLESIMISSYMLGAKKAYIYIRGEYLEAIEKIKTALENSDEIMKWYKDKINDEFEIILVKGAGAYICGDETSLINSIQGLRPSSRIKPPYPVEEGLYGKPTIVNNVETLSNVPLIIRDGGEKYAEIGSGNSKGTKLISLSGKTKNTGVFEVEFGKVTLQEIVYDIGGGIRDGNKLKFVIPGGVSTKIIKNDEIDVPYSYEGLSKIGTSLGSGAIVVGDDSISLLDVAISATDFFMRETCGTCFPCKEGNRQTHYLLEKLKKGLGEVEYLELIKEISETTNLSARCGLGQAAGNLVVSSIEKFRDDFLKFVE